MIYIILYILLEFYEVQWQKAESMMGMLSRMYQNYNKNIFIFFIMHPTFYFAIYLMIYTNYNIYALILFTLKVVDIALKIILIKKVFIDKEISQEIANSLFVPLPSYLPYIGILIYPFFVYMALI